MPRVGDVFQLLSGTLAVPNTTIASGPYNAQQNDWVTEANSPRPVSAGGTGETTAAEARESLGAMGVGDLAAADTKAAVLDTDSVVIIDSEDANTNKRWLVSDLETRILTLNPPVAQTRNRLVNGGFQISQEFGDDTPATITGAYPADQWKITRTVATGIVTAVWDTATSSQPYRLRLQTTTDQVTIGSGAWLLSQTMEGTRTADFRWGSASGSPAVLRIRVQAAQVGTYGFFIRNNPATHTYAGTFSILGTISGPSGDIAPSEVGRIVEKIIAIPAPPAGTAWAVNTAAGVTVGFTMAAATGALAPTPGWYASGFVNGVTGQTNLLATLSAEIVFSAVSLHFDPDGTGAPPKWEIPDYAEELRACQRYWQVVQLEYSADVTATRNYYTRANLPVLMRATPALTGNSFTAANFPPSPGTLSGGSSLVAEVRAATGTGAGRYLTIITANARL